MPRKSTDSARSPHPDVPRPGLPILHPYVRISDPSQRKGGGVERQTTADIDDFCRRFGFQKSQRLWIDDGVSAWKGLNATPDHELGKFLIEARRGAIRPGDCLLLENYDRLSRQNPWSAIGLVGELRELRIHVGRLDRMKLLRYDSNDTGDFFEAAIEFVRGNSESELKSYRNSAAWEKKRKRAREKGETVTPRVPAWVEERDGKRHPIPERAAVIKKIFHLSATGYGSGLIVKRFVEEKVPPFGRMLTDKEIAAHCRYREECHSEGRCGPLTKEYRASLRVPGTWRSEPDLTAPDIKSKRIRRWKPAAWCRTYISAILQSRSVLGEYQPRRVNGELAGEVVKDYFPAVVTEDEWNAAHAGRIQRAKCKGRQRTHVNIFGGLLKDAVDKEYYYYVTHTNKQGKHTRALENLAAREARGKIRSFPAATFEAAILLQLHEVDPHDILNGDSGPDETLALGAKKNRLEVELNKATEIMKRRGISEAIAEQIYDLEGKLRTVTEQLREAREKAAHPLSETWGEAQTLLKVLNTAADPKDFRIRLRAALRKIVESIWLYVVPTPNNLERFCAAQVWFYKSSSMPVCRTYFIQHRYFKRNHSGWVQEGGWRVCSFAETADQLHSSAHLKEEPAEYDPIQHFEQIDGFRASLGYDPIPWHPLPS